MKLDYFTIRATSVTDLDFKVNAQMKKGYRPIGKVYVFKDENNGAKEICQPMLRKNYWDS